MADPRTPKIQIAPEGRQVWTDEFDPAGEYLPMGVIQMRRARRVSKLPDEGPGLGLDLRETGTPPLDSQQPTESTPGSSFPENGDLLHHAMLLQLLRANQSPA